LFSILQFDERVISLLRVRPSAKGIAVESYETEHGKWSSEDGSLRAALSAFVKRFEVAADDVYSVLPRHDMTARILTLPSQDEEEIGNMIRLSAEEYVPYPVEELVVDQCILQKLATGGSRVMAVFAHRDLVDTHVAILHAAGIDPERIYVSSACLASAVRTLEVAPERYAMVNLGSGGLEVLAFHGHRLEYARGIATTQDWSTAHEADSEAIHELSMELRASLAAHRRETDDGLGAEHVYVCSEWMDVKPVCDVLTHESERACEPANFVNSLIVDNREKVPHLPLVLMGAALTVQGRAGIAINLVPESLTRVRHAATMKKQAKRTAVLAGALLIVLLGLYGQGVYQRTAYIGELQTQADSIRGAATGVAAKVRELMTIQERVSRQGTILELWANIADIAPNDLTIESFSYDREENLVIAGRAMDRTLVDRFADNLRGLSVEGFPEFANAKQTRDELTKERGQDVMWYEISIPFPQADDAEETES
jgi:hypothetical protein